MQYLNRGDAEINLGGLHLGSLPSRVRNTGDRTPYPTLFLGRVDHTRERRDPSRYDHKHGGAFAGRRLEITPVLNRALFVARVFKAAGQAFLLVHPSHRIGGSVTLPNGETASNGSGDEIFGHSHAFYNRSLLRQTGGNSRGEDSTGAVSICRIDSLYPKLDEISAIIENVGGYVLEVPAFHNDILWPQVADRSRRVFHLLEGIDFVSS